MIISKRSIEQNNVDNFTTKALILSVNVFIFCTKVLIEVIILTSSNADGTAILRGHPNHAKVYPFAGQRQYLHFSVISRP